MNSDLASAPRLTGEFSVRNTQRAAAHASRLTERILVRLPFNDYLLHGRNAGKMFTGEMTVSRKPIYGGGNAVEIRAAGHYFRVEAFAYRFQSSTGRPIGRARLMFRAV